MLNKIEYGTKINLDILGIHYVLGIATRLILNIFTVSTSARIHSIHHESHEIGFEQNILSQNIKFSEHNFCASKIEIKN